MTKILGDKKTWWSIWLLILKCNKINLGEEFIWFLRVFRTRKKKQIEKINLILLAGWQKGSKKADLQHNLMVGRLHLPISSCLQGLTYGWTSWSALSQNSTTVSRVHKWNSIQSNTVSVWSLSTCYCNCSKTPRNWQQQQKLIWSQNKSLTSRLRGPKQNSSEWQWVTDLGCFFCLYQYGCHS